MTLKEEIYKKLEATTTYDWEDNPDRDWLSSELIQIFKKWALECVGKDRDGKFIDSNVFEIWNYQNQEKKEIRKRIKDSLK